ncbi:MAG: hypothetical protein NTX61_04860 [Bacteroidetes bacterium]|nr:hypothetical protein [Bacteroidota bacterium]
MVHQSVTSFSASDDLGITTSGLTDGKYMLVVRNNLEIVYHSIFIERHE